MGDGRCRIMRLPLPVMKDLRSEYDRWHQMNASGTGPWYRLVWDALERRELLADARVLEIGCGGGDFAARLAAAGARTVIGQDFAPVAIDHACERFQANNLIFEVGDIEQIRYPDSHFDVVVSCETLEHVPNPRRAVSELARVLRPGGTLMLTTPNYMGITGLHRLYVNMTGRKWDEGGQPLVRWTVLPRTVRWLKLSGLAVDLVDGEGWYLPVPGRPGGYALTPPASVRALMAPFALHQLIEARHVLPRTRKE